MKPDSKPSPTDDPVVLAVTGMTCAACAARIEKKLNKIDGVVATVNYATSKATVTGIEARPDASHLVSVIEGLGYGAVAPNIDDGESTVEIATEAASNSTSLFAANQERKSGNQRGLLYQTAILLTGL